MGCRVHRVRAARTVSGSASATRPASSGIARRRDRLGGGLDGSSVIGSRGIGLGPSESFSCQLVDADAERECAQAVWTPVEGWSRTAVELAKARMASGRPRDAIAALRTAYATRLDAMGRYVPISELDFWMARAFSEAGEADSARVYRAFFDRAWANADPDVRRQLTQANAATARP